LEENKKKKKKRKGKKGGGRKNETAGELFTKRVSLYGKKELGCPASNKVAWFLKIHELIVLSGRGCGRSSSLSPTPKEGNGRRDLLSRVCY